MLLEAFTVKFNNKFKAQNSVIRIFLLKFTWLGMQNQDGMSYKVQKRVTLESTKSTKPWDHDNHTYPCVQILITFTYHSLHVLQQFSCRYYVP
jgi:hypothetical protein